VTMYTPAELSAPPSCDDSLKRVASPKTKLSQLARLLLTGLCSYGHESVKRHFNGPCSYGLYFIRLIAVQCEQKVKRHNFGEGKKKKKKKGRRRRRYWRREPNFFGAGGAAHGAEGAQFFFGANWRRRRRLILEPPSPKPPPLSPMAPCARAPESRAQ
jgi:hypothetical protein